MTAAERTVAEFIERINAHDVAGLAERVTEDHRLVDGAGAVVQGREAVRSAWEAHFRAAPGYRIEVASIISRGKLVAVFGSAHGGVAERAGSLPAAWRAVVRGAKVAEWQVYADSGPARALLAG